MGWIEDRGRVGVDQEKVRMNKRGCKRGFKGNSRNRCSALAVLTCFIEPQSFNSIAESVFAVFVVFLTADDICQVHWLDSHKYI